MTLSGQEFKKLKSALIDAFPTTVYLEEMLFVELTKNLTAIAGEGSLENIVFKLIQTADSQGWVEDLVRASRKSNPRNKKLCDVAQELIPNYLDPLMFTDLENSPTNKIVEHSTSPTHSSVPESGGSPKSSQDFQNNKQQTIPSSSSTFSFSFNSFNQSVKKIITGGTILLFGLVGFSLYNQNSNLPKDPNFYYQQGLNYASAHPEEWDNAISDYDQAIKLKPDYTDAYYNRGLAYRAR